LSEKEIVLTAEGLQKLKDELDDLKSVHRREVSERIRQAKEFGDLSENAEYEDAKQEQAFVEGRILKIEAMLRNVRIIDSSEYADDEVNLGAEVKIKSSDGTDYTFTIVGSTESDPPNHRLSNESPLGKALIGRKKGEHIEVKTPRGMTNYTIEAISTKKTAKR
jgi:transcription elongation factor GreA